MVQFYDNTSPTLPVVSGIGLGTILGPILFIFYINDITTVIKNLKINMYADNCILYTSGIDWNRMRQKVQPEVCNIQRWYHHNRLKINDNKSKVLLFGSGNKLGKIDFSNNISLGNVPLAFTTKYKYLGVILDSEMSFPGFLAETKRVVSNRLFDFRKLRHYITEQASQSVYL